MSISAHVIKTADMKLTKKLEIEICEMSHKVEMMIASANGHTRRVRRYQTRVTLTV